MDKEKILKKAIDKAVKNVGEFEIWPGLFCTGCQLHLDGDIYLELKLEYNKATDGKRSDNIIWQFIEPEQVIFNHEFAKAFFGEQRVCAFCDGMSKKHTLTKGPYDWDECSNCGLLVEGEYAEERWKIHLRQMVLEKEPVQYFKKFL